jgi:hypothetical protein
VVPAPYHEFFSGCANVAGALVGLLFVAISVSPEKLAGEEATIAFQLRAAAAFSVLVNALVLTLFALLPSTNLGLIALIAGLSGIGTTAGLVILQVRESNLRRIRDFVIVVLLVPLYGYQLISAVALLDKPGDTDALQAEAIVVVICFLVGIGRAWELLGGRRTGIVHTTLRLTTRDRSSPAGGAGSEQLEPDSGVGEPPQPPG